MTDLTTKPVWPSHKSDSCSFGQEHEVEAEQLLS